VKTILPVNIFFFVIVVFACSSGRNQVKGLSGSGGLEGGWQLVQPIAKSTPDTIYRGEIPYLEFLEEENKIMGYSGCNQFYGKVVIAGDSIRIGQLASTKKYCFHVPEAAFFDALRTASNYKLSRNELRLLDGEKLLLTFKRKVN
jgi:putative lipoprotein